MNPSDKDLQAASEYAKKHGVSGYGGFDTESWLDLAFLAGRESTREEIKVLREALEKIADPRKRDHAEPDLYTRYGCVMNIAQEALEKVGE